MAHISELALFDYAARKADLTVEETGHLEECDDCREEVIALKRVMNESADLQKTRKILAEEGELPLPEELSRTFGDL
jgi:predicted anti-sigma-YlaC factor YlaD